MCALTFSFIFINQPKQRKLEKLNSTFSFILIYLIAFTSSGQNNKSFYFLFFIFFKKKEEEEEEKDRET